MEKLIESDDREENARVVFGVGGRSTGDEIGYPVQSRIEGDESNGNFPGKYQQSPKGQRE